MRVDLFSLLTSNYSGTNIKMLMELISSELSNLRDKSEEISLQGSIFDSTWGLGDWEKELDIIPPISMTIEQRKQRVYSHINTYVPSNKQQLIDALKVYGYDADVIEHVDTFFIELVLKVNNVLMFPIDDILDDIEDIVPAHHEYLFYINYNYNIGIKSYIKKYLFDYDLCGTAPDISTLGVIEQSDIVSKTSLNAYQFKSIETNTDKVGIFPDLGTLGVSDCNSIVSNDGVKMYSVEYVLCGTN